MNVTVNGIVSILSTNFTANSLNLTANTSVNAFTMTGNATLTVPSIGNLSVIFGGSNSTGMVLTNGSLTSVNMTVNSNLSVAGSTFNTTGLNITANTVTNAFTMTGNSSVSVPSVGNISVVFGGANSTGLVVTNSTLTSMNVTVSGNVSILGTNITANSLNLTANAAANTFTMTGNATMSVPSMGNLSVIFGGANSTGMVLTNGSLTSVNMTVNSNLTLAGSTFSTVGLNITANTVTNAFTMTGNSSVNVPSVGNISVIFGGSNSTGLTVTNGSLTSMNVTVGGDLSILSTNFTANRLNMTVNTTANTFTMTGNATLSQSKIGSLSVIFGGANSTGLILTNGSLTSVNMTVNSNLTVAGSTFQTVGLNITANTITNKFTMKGNAFLNLPSIGALSVGFGSGSTTGFELTNGVLTTLNATVTGNLSIGGVSFATNNLTFAVNTVNDTFSLTGGSSFTATGIGNLNVYFGGIGTTGLVIANGTITSLTMTVTSNLAFAGVTFNTAGMIITGDTANSIYTMTGCTSASVTGIGNIDVQFGKKDLFNNVMSRGLVITSGSISLLDMTVNNNISLAGLTFSTANMNFNYTAATNSTPSQFSMTGLTSATIASLGSISFGFGCSTTGGTPTKGLVISCGSLTSFDMSVTSSLTVGGLNFSTNNLTFLYNASPSFFAMRGLTSVTVPSVGSLSVGFGSGTSNGLVVTSGALTSLDMTVNSNLNIGSLNITTRNLNFNYTAASNNFTMRGTAAVAMPSIGNLEVTLGSNTTNGLVITNGSFTSLDMTVNSNFSAGSLSFTTRNLNINYISGNNSFAMTGTAAMAMPSIGNLEVTLGKTAANGTIINRGLVINNGAFSSLDITVNSNFSTGNLQFYTKDLNVQYYNSNATFMMKGTAGLDLPSIGNVNVTLGNATRNGLVFVNGAFQSFDFTLNSNIRVGMVDITTQDLNFAYTNSNQTFTMRGTAGVAMPSIGNVNVTLGNATRNGLVITNGALVSLDMTLNSNFRAGGILFTTRNLNFTYVTSTSEFTMSGTAAVAMPSLGSVEVTLGKVDDDGTVRSRGLIVRNGNFVSLDMTVNANIQVYAVTLYTRNLNFTYVEDTKIFTMSGTAGALMPIGLVEVTLGKVDLDGTVRSRGLVVKDGDFVSLDMTINSVFLVGGCAVYTKNLNFTYVMATDTFTMSGSAGVILPTAGYVDVTLGQFAKDGTKLSSGLIVQGGNFVSLDMTLNSSITINGVTFATKNLNFTYVESTKTFTLAGTASLSVPVLATVEVVFGGGDTKGLVVTNGNLISLDMTVNASVLGVGPYSLGSANMKFNYSTSTQMFTMTGTAKMGLPELGGMSVNLGGDGTSGMVINTQTNTLVSLNMSVDSDFSVAGLTFARSHLRLNYSDSEKSFTMSGTATVNLYIQSFTATLGGNYTKSDGTTATSSGLVIRNGQLDSLDFSITDTVGLAGVSLGSATLYVSYDGPKKTFDLNGTADMTLKAKLPSWAKTFMGLSGSGDVHLGTAKVVVHVEPGYSSQGDNTASTANLPSTGFDFESPDVTPNCNLNGIDQFFQIPNNGLDNLTNGFTAGMWIRPTSVKNWARFFDFGNGANSDNILLARFETSNSLIFSVRRGSSEQYLKIDNAITLDTWQYISVVQQSNGSTTIYKNGAVIGTGMVQTPNNVVRNNCYIGKSNWSSDSYYAGYMSDFNIWNRPLSAGQAYSVRDNFSGIDNGLVYFSSLKGYQPNVATSTWTFSTHSGITGNQGAFTTGTQNAPQGVQAAYLQNQGSMTTSAVTMTPGKKYAITFAQAERSIDTVKNPVEVLMDGQLLGTFTATGSSYISFSTAAFTATAGSHTLVFRGTISTGDSTAFIDNISINEQVDQPVLINTPVNPTPYSTAVSMDGTSNSKIQLPSYGFNDFTNGLSVGVWVYPTNNLSGFKPLFELGNGSNYMTLSQWNSQLSIEIFNGSGSSNALMSSSGVVELNKWQYLQVVQKPDGTTTLYKNGNMVASGTQPILSNINRTVNYISGSYYDGYFSGRMNALSLFNRALNDNEVAGAMNTVYAGTENGLVGYWPLNDLASGQVDDFGPNKYSGTAGTGVSNYNIPIDFSTPYADALAFDGSNTYVQLPSSGFANFTNGLSAGVWVYPTSVGNWARFFEFGNGPDSNNIIMARDGSTNDLVFRVWRGSVSQSLFASNVIELNTWQYFSVSQQSNGSTTIYKNGVAIATGNVQTANNLGRVNNYVGKSNWSGDSLFAGRMNDLTIWNRGLTQSEMASAPYSTYNGSESGLIGYWPMNEGSGGTVVDHSTGTINDRSQNALNGTVTNSVYPQATGASALTFNGSANSYVTLSSSGLSDFTGGFSSGIWVYPTSNAMWQRFFDIGNGPLNNNIMLCRNGTSNDLGFYSYNGGAATAVIASNVIELNKWQYFAVSMQSNGSTTLYKNGVAVASGTVYVPQNVTRNNAYVGKSNWNDPIYSGQMSDLSIWNRPLTQTEISSAASTLFTGNETGLVGYWPMKELSGTTVREVSLSQRNGTAQSSVTSTVAPAGRATVPVSSALRFDGSTGYATLPATGFADFRNGFSAGVWVYPTSANSWARFFDFGNGPLSDNILMTRGYISNDLYFTVHRGSVSQSICATNAIELNKWQYFSVSQQADGTTTIYKNGVAMATGNVQTANNISRVNNYVGKSNWSADSLFAGQMAGLSVWNRGLSAGEMARAQTAIFAGSEPGLVGYWPMMDVDHQLDGTVYGGISSVPTTSLASFNADFETGSGWAFTETTAGYGSFIVPNGSVYGNPIAPSGMQAVMLRGAMAQTVSGFTAGVPYTLSFYAAQRAGFANQTVQIKMDNTVIGTITPDSIDYKLYRLSDFIPGAGPHVLTFTSQNSGDRTIFLDQIAFTAGDPIGINLDFEGSDGWAFSETTPGLDYGAYAPNGSYWGNNNAVSGNRAIALRGSMWQNLSGFSPGASYTLSFYGALRTGTGAQTIQIMMDNEVIGNITPSSSAYTLYKFPGIQPGAGIHTLKFVSQVSGDHTVFIDNVTLNSDDPKPIKSAIIYPAPQFFNNSFESQISGNSQYVPSGTSWTFSNNNFGICKNGQVFLSGGDNAPEGSQAAFLQINSSISQTISGFMTGQLYDMTFKMRNRHGFNANPLSLIVSMDGVELGTYLNSNGEHWQTFTIKEIDPEPGNHTFTFSTNYNSGMGDVTVLLDKIEFAISGAQVVNDQPNISRGPKNSYAAFTIDVGDVDVGLQVYFDGSVNIVYGDVFGATFNRVAQDFVSGFKATASAFSTGYKQVTYDVGKAYTVTASAFEAGANAVAAAASTATSAVVSGLKKAGRKLKRFFNFYVDGSTVYYDPAGIGSYTPGNPTSTTGADGSFDLTLLDSPTGQLLGFGGTITATAQPNDATYTAIATAQVLSPLTTLVNNIIVAAPATAVTDAVSAIDVGLGLPSSYNLNASGTMENALQGDDSAARAFAAEVKVYTVAHETAALLHGLDTGKSINSLMTKAFASIFSYITANPGSAIDLTSTATIKSLIQSTATAASITISDELATGGASVIADVEQSIENLAASNLTEPGTLAFLQKVAAYQRVSDGTVALQLALAANGSITVDALTANVTVANLTVWANGTTIGNLRPPVVTLVSDANLPTPHTAAGAGQQNYIDFPVTVSGTASSLLPISLQYTTGDGTALAARGDYTPANGTLTWAPGDTSTKTIRVNVGTGSLVEISKQFSLTVSNPTNSIFEYATTVGTIDYSVFDTTTDLITSSTTATAFSPVTFTATATYLDSANSPASGRISFYDGSTLLGNVTTNAQGVATFTTSELRAGNHAISARYSGYNVVGGIYRPSVSSNLTQTIVKANQTITLDALSSKTYGDGASNLTGNTTWNLPINYAVLSGPASIASGVLSVNGVGHVVIEATQAGNDWVNPAPTVGFEFDITPATLSVVVDSQSIQYGNGTLPTLTYSTTGFVMGQNISLATSPISVSTVAATSHAGTYSITGSGLTVPNYNVQYINGSLTIRPAALTVTVADKAMTYGSSLPALTYAISGFVNGDTSANLTSLPLVTTAPASSNVGVYQITANGVVDTDYIVSYVPANLTISKADLLISAANTSMTYGGTMPALSANYNGLVNGDTSANFTAVPILRTVPGSSDAGNYTITAESAINDNYNITYANGTLAIGKAGLTVTANNQTTVIGRSVPTLTSSYSGFVNGDTADRLSSPPILNASADSSAIGVYGITVGGAASPNYNFNYVNGTLTVTRQSTGTAISSSIGSPVYGQNITFTAGVTTTDTIAAVTSGAIQFKVDGTNFGSPVTIDSNGLASFSSSSLSRGNHTITAAYAGDATNIASTQDILVNVSNYASQTLVTPSHSTFKAGYAASFSVTISGTDPSAPIPTGTVQFMVDGAAFGSSVAINSGMATSGNLASLTIGTHSISAAYTDSSGLFQSSVGSSSVVVITALTQSVTFNPLGSATYGDSPVSLTACASTSFPVAFSVISGPGTISGNNLTITGAGSIVVEATQAGDSLYAPSSTRQTQVVNRANQTITFGSLGNATYGGSPISLAGTSSSSLAVTYSIVSGPGSISGNSLSITGSGTVIVQASQTGNGNFNAATDVQSSLVVQQAISATSVSSSSGSSIYGQNVTFTASVTAPGLTPNGSVQFYVDGQTFGSPKTLVSGQATSDIATLLNVGSHTISANYIGTGDIVGSLSSNISQSIARANLSVVANNLVFHIGSSFPTLTGVITGAANGDSISANYSSPATANSSAGIYPITVAVQDPLNRLSNYNLIQTNGTLSVYESYSTTVTLATDTVDPLDFAISLREAIDYGVQLGGNQTVSFAPGIFSANSSTITLTQGALTINKADGILTIQGPSVASGNTLTITGNGTSGLFKILTPTVLSNLSLTNGRGSNGTSPNIQGGAIYSNSTLQLDRVSIQNSTANFGNAIYQTGGTLSLNSSSNINSIYVANNGNLLITGSQSTSLGQINACSITVNLTAGDITQTSGTSLSISGTASFVAAGNVSLNQSSNDFGTIQANATVLSVTDSNAIVLDQIRVSNLTVQASGAISQSGAANVSGNTNLNAPGYAIALSQANNSLGDVTSNGLLTISNGVARSLTPASGSANISGGTITGNTITSVNLNQTGGTLGTLIVNGGTTTITTGIISGTTTINSGALVSSGTLNNGLILNVGTATLNGGAINRSGNNSAVLITSGNLTAHNTTINGATGSTGNTPTVMITGGTVDLGNATTAGNNTLTLGNGTRYLLFNNASANVSAIGNVWNGVDAATANNSQLFDTVDRIIDSVDHSSLGLVRIKANRVYMTPESFHTPLSSTSADVQRAIDIASPGDTVQVKAGDYKTSSNNGVVRVSKSLTITGDGAVVTSVRAFVLDSGSDITAWSGISAASNVTIHSGAVISNATATPSLVNLIESNGSLIFDSGASFGAQLNVVDKNLTITSNSTNIPATITTLGNGTAISLSGTGNATLTDLTLGGSGSAIRANHTGSLTIDRLALNPGLAVTSGVVGAISNNGAFTFNGQNQDLTYTFNNTGFNTTLFNSQYLSFSPSGNTTINAGNATDTFAVDRVMLATTISGGAGDDTFNLGSINTLASVTMISGDSGTNSLNAPTNRSNEINVTGNTTGNLNTANQTSFAQIQNISGGNMNDTVTISRSAIIVSIAGGGGVDTIRLNSNTNDTATINLTGVNTGDITATGGTSAGIFTGISKLIGSDGNDTFRFLNNNVQLSGSIDGGSGTNAINYASSTKPIFVNLGTGQATGVTATTSTGVVANIHDILAGPGNDYLLGSSASNIIDGGAGDDTIMGQSGNDILVGNYGADSINGGAGYDILIGGFVDFGFGTLQEGLQAIMASWKTIATEMSFNSVSNNISTITAGQYRLIGDTNLSSTYIYQTVFNDAAADRLTDIASSTTPNWFFATERVTSGNDVVLAGTTFTVSKKTITSKTGRTAR